MMFRPRLVIWCLAVSFWVSIAVPGVRAADQPVLSATAAGVIGDGVTLDTASLQQAIDDCANAGGGTIDFPKGRYLTGTIQLKSRVKLRLEEGATLLGSTDAENYRNVDPFTDGTGNPLGYALIVAVDAEDVGIEGPGMVDGQGLELKKKEGHYVTRPFLLRFVRCAIVSVKDVHLTNPGAWTLHLSQSKNVQIENVTIRSRVAGLVNNDGIDIDSSQNVHIHNCDIVSGDDALVIKASSRANPSRNIDASGCKLSSATNAIKLGTESIGGFQNIRVTDCQITNTRMAGIALYEVDGAELANVQVSDVSMDGVGAGISIRLGARLKSVRAGDAPRPAPGRLHTITIRNVTARKIALIGILMNGLQGHPVEEVLLDHIRMEVPGGGTSEEASIQLPEKEADYPEYTMFGKSLPASGFYARHVSELNLKDVQITALRPDERPPVVFVDVQDVNPADFASGKTGP